MRDTGFFIAARFYASVLACVLAIFGVFSIFGWHFGWLAPSKPAPPKIAVQSDTLPIETEKPLLAAGPKTLTSQLIPVDPSLTYDLSAEVRSIAPPGIKRAAVLTFLGVITYDQNGKEIRGGPGTYRYAGALDYNLYSGTAWREVSGPITGEGNETHHQFRPGTRFVRVVALLNYRAIGTSVEREMMTSEIRNVRFSARAEMSLY